MEYVLNTLEKSISGSINEVNTNTNTEIANRKALIDKVETEDTSTVTVGTSDDSLNLMSKGRLQNNGQEIALVSDVEGILEPYTINLTNLLAAQDSESISTAIGGIDNLNATVTKNQVIFGTLANGTVAVGIRVLGNQTTLTYFVDSLAGLTVNEVIITNTSGTLTKTANTHAILTENMVINSLTSDETTLPLSAAQGKALDNKISSIDVSADITNAINALDSSGQTASTGEVISSVSQENGVISVSKKTLTSDDIPELPQSKIQNLTDDLAGKQDTLNFNTPYNASNNKAATMQDVANSIDDVIPTGTTYPQSFVLTNIGNSSGTIPLSFKELTGSNRTETNELLSTGIGFSYGVNPGPYIMVEGITDAIIKENVVLTDSKTIVGAINELKESVDSKQDSLTPGTGLEITEDNTINVTLDTTVFFVAESAPASPSEDQKKKICLVPADTTEEGNFYIEYVWVVDDTHPDGYWEEFGTYKSEVDLTPYLKSADAANTYLSKIDAASTYATQTNLTAHTSNTENPHNVTKAQVGLGNVDNTSDVDKPISTATQNALNGKQATLVSGTNIKTINNQSLLGSGNISIPVPSSIDVTTLFADTASISSGISTQIAALGNSGVTEFPVLYAGSAIGNIKPTWIRTTSGVTNMMCIADNKIWYFEIQGTTVQRASLAIS